MSSVPATQRPKKLPAQFADLQQWDEWIQWDDRSRIEKHVTTSVEDLAAVYNALLPRAGEIYDYLSGVRLDGEISDEDMALLVLAIVLAEIADGVEHYSPGSTAAVDMPRWKTFHDSIFVWQGK